MAVPKINNFEELLQPILKSSGKLLNYEAKFLTASGENYGSCLVAIEARIQKQNESAEKFSCVAKLCPINAWLKRMFASHITFRKEIGFYVHLVPELIAFQKSCTVKDDKLLDIFPKCYSGRLSLSNDILDLADDDAVLLLENLKISEYKLLNRFVGFNFEEAEIVLKSLARFHSVPLAYKIKHPVEFKEKMMPFLDRVLIGKEMLDQTENKFCEAISRHLILNEEDHKRFIKGMNVGYNFQRNFPAGKEKYATIVHCDFWLNNTMVKFDDEKPVSNKMLDFQVNTYGSPASDLVFFLFTSISQQVLEQKYDQLLNIYYEEFVNCLEEHLCDTSNYTFDSFLEEVNLYGKLEASHVLIMHKAIFSSASEKSVNDMNMDDMFNDSNISDIYKNRLNFTVQTFLKKNWI